MGRTVDGFGRKTVVHARFIAWELGAVKNLERKVYRIRVFDMAGFGVNPVVVKKI